MIDTIYAWLNVTAFWVGWISQTIVISGVLYALWSSIVTWTHEQGVRGIYTLFGFGYSWINTLHHDMRDVEQLVMQYRYPYYKEGGMLKILMLPKWVIRTLQRLGKIKGYDTPEQIQAARMQESIKMWSEPNLEDLEDGIDGEHLTSTDTTSKER